MRNDNQPVYMIGIAARLCKVHPQTLRQYERLGLVVPNRAGAKNRLFSEADIRKVQRIQRLTQELGVNLAGVEVILKMLDNMEEMRADMQHQFESYRRQAEERIHSILANSNVPLRRDEPLLPVPNIRLPDVDL